MQQKETKKIFLYTCVVFLIMLIAIPIVLFVSRVTYNSGSISLNSSQSKTDDKLYVNKFITALPVDISQIASISKFRSCSGHDYSSANIDGQQETNRSMKHYINPLDSLVGSVNTIKVFAPFDGTIAAIVPDAASNVQVGLQVWLTPSANPTWSLIYYHIKPLVKTKDAIKAGQLIGFANLSRSSVIDFDIALEAWVQNVAYPLGSGNLGTLNLALQREPNYLQLLHTGQLDSIFNHMNSEVLAQFADRGISQQNIIVSKVVRDASPCPQVTNNGHYQSTSNDNVILR